MSSLPCAAHTSLISLDVLLQVCVCVSVTVATRLKTLSVVFAFVVVSVFKGVCARVLVWSSQFEQESQVIKRDRLA